MAAGGVDPDMRRIVRVLCIAGGLYALAWAAYVAKSAAGINLFVEGGHHGALFPGSDHVVGKLYHG